MYESLKWIFVVNFLIVVLFSSLLLLFVNNFILVSDEMFLIFKLEIMLKSLKNPLKQLKNDANRWYDIIFCFTAFKGSWIIEVLSEAGWIFYTSMKVCK